MQNKINNIRTWAEDDLVGLARQVGPAFTELMRRTRLSSLKLAYSILRDVPEAEDQVQNAYWKVTSTSQTLRAIRNSRRG